MGASSTGLVCVSLSTERPEKSLIWKNPQSYYIRFPAETGTLGSYSPKQNYFTL